MMLIGLRCLISFPSNTFTRFMHMVGYTNTNPILFSDVVVLLPLTYSLQLLPVTVSPAGKGANRAHCCLSEIQITLHRKLRLWQVGTQGPRERKLYGSLKADCGGITVRRPKDAGEGQQKPIVALALGEAVILASGHMPSIRLRLRTNCLESK